MFSADLTWTPVAEARPEPRRKESKDEPDNRSARSSDTKGSSRRLRWPLSRKAKSTTRDIQASAENMMHASAVHSPTNSSLLTHPPQYDSISAPPPPKNTNAAVKSSNPAIDPTSIAHKYQVYELPGTNVMEKTPVRTQSNIVSPAPRPTSSLPGVTEVSLVQHSPASVVHQIHKLEGEFVTTRAALSHRDFQSIDPANSDHGSPPSSPPRLIPSHIDTQFQPLSCRKSLSRKRIGSQKSRASTLTVRSDMSSVQRLILRMDRASRETMLQRIQEAWIVPLDESQQYEIELEKFLWVLAALNLRCYEPTLRIPTATPSTDLTSFPHRSGNLLELAHGIADVHQLAAFQPTARITYAFTGSANLAFPFPNVTPVMISDNDFEGLPIPDASTDHIRSNSLSSVFPALQLKRVLSECNRVLVPGGTIELRVIDPSPDPKEPVHKLQSWMDQYLIFNLEKCFRCLRPNRLIPVWLEEAGFEIDSRTLENTPRRLRFPCFIKEDSCTVEHRLACEIGRRLWNDVWGNYIESGARHWWEDESIINESDRKSVV